MKYFSLFLLMLILSPATTSAQVWLTSDMCIHPSGEIERKRIHANNRLGAVPFTTILMLQRTKVISDSLLFLGYHRPFSGTYITALGYKAGENLTDQNHVFILGENIPVQEAMDSTIYIGNSTTEMIILPDGSLLIDQVLIKRDPTLYESLRRCEMLLKSAFKY